MAFDEYASRIGNVKGSIIREILKVVGKPGIISFAGGNPSPDALADKLIAKICQDVFDKSAKSVLQYGATEGYYPFREALCNYIEKSLGIKANTDEILPTTGSTQGMDILCKLFLEPQDTVVCENPTFVGNLQCLKLYQVKLIGIDCQSDGIDIDKLESILKKQKIKMLYTIPNFHNPQGICMSLEKRKMLLSLAEKYNFLIVEDDPYRELRYEDTDIPSIKSMDTNGHVAYIGSFSKTLAPALRLGYIFAHSDTIKKCSVIKQSSDVHTCTLSQAIAEKYITEGHIYKHIEYIKNLYGQKLNTMDNQLKHIENINYIKPKGGMFIFINTPNSFNAIEKLARSVELGMAYVPGAFFYVERAMNNTIRLNFSNADEDGIIKGIKILNNLLKEN